MDRTRFAGRAVVAFFVVAAPVSPAPGQAKTFDTQIIRNVAYHQGPDADPVRHRLDIYLPKGHKDFPVLMFVHGGAWIEGDKNHFGIYNALARCFTRHGIALVCPNYRLSPAVKHPEHIRDVAKAFAWTHKNIGKYGGQSKEIFVGGHSAGGHLCALLATDETFLKAEGLSLRAIKGAIPVSGLFTIPNDRIYELAFGKDPAVRKAASPVNHVRAGDPPFFIILGDSDLPGCDLPQATAFSKRLKENKVPAQLIEVPRRNHVSILLNAVNDTDPVTQSMLSFIMSQVTIDCLAQGGCEGIDTLGCFIARYAAGK